MLKVVGASWQKTRIGTYILIGAGLLVIGAFFISYMDRPEYSGTYCATAFWNKQVNFQIEYWKQQNDLLNIPKGAARICYKDTIHINGWAQMEIETQRSYPDWVQALGAGMLEGSLTWNSIYNQWVNTIQSSCEKDESTEKFCAWLRELLEDNFQTIKEAAFKHRDNDRYWHQISLFLYQLEGLEAGYQRGAKRARSDLEEEIPFSDFILMNAAADIHDLKIYYENFVNNETKQADEAEKHPKNFFLPSATMLTKIIQNKENQNRQLLFGHSTAGSYASMLRIQKRYKFHFHFSPNQRSHTVPGNDITFTSYPGILGSTDDFYIVKGRQVHSIVAGVGIRNENLSLWRSVNLNQAVPLVGRVMAANRIAQNRRTWSKAMSRHPHTGAKQWVTVDIRKLGPQDNLYNTLAEDEKHDDAPFSVNPYDEAAIQDRHNRNKGLIWIVEQLPGRLHMKDITDTFLANGNATWVANGIPYFDEILEASAVSRDNYSSDLTPAIDAELTSLEAVDKYLRTHGFRGDLMGEESVAYGNIDLKLYSYNARLGMSDYHAIAGPIFMRLQHVQPRAADLDLDTKAEALSSNSESEISFKTSETQVPGVNAAIGDERLSVIIEDADEMAELEMITERRSVRNDMKALAMRQISAGPFKWSSVEDKISNVEHEGHPDEWNFEKVSPNWAW